MAEANASATCPLGRTLDPILRDALGQGMLRCERQRARAMLVLLLGIMGIMLAFRWIPGLVGAGLQSRFQHIAIPVSVSLLAFAAYEWVIMAWLGRLGARGGVPSTAFRYLNTAVEVSYPTVMLLVLASRLGPVHVLNGAMPLLYFPFIALAALSLDWRLCAFSGTVAALGFAATAVALLRHQPEIAGLPILVSPRLHAFKGIYMIAAGLVSGFVAGRLKIQMEQALRSARERDRAVNIFGQHVSPQVAERLLTQPIELSGEERHVCVMFLDIRNFSRTASERSPAEVMDYLNTLFGPMIASVNAHHGIVNKFLGDGFMAVFGAPTDDPDLCRHAARCAAAILRQVAALNAAGSIPPTRVGIGLHAGPAITGNVGSAQRKEYTIIGDTVNIAARAEQTTKLYDAQLLVTEPVWRAIDDRETAAEDLGEVELKGQPRPIRLFKLA